MLKKFLLAMALMFSMKKFVGLELDGFFVCDVI